MLSWSEVGSLAARPRSRPADAGSSVVVLEKATATRGTTRKAAAWFWIPDNRFMPGRPGMVQCGRAHPGRGGRAGPEAGEFMLASLSTPGWQLVCGLVAVLLAVVPVAAFADRGRAMSHCGTAGLPRPGS